jgi:energy-coupling factor transporter ATP-binding protein EcfA2
MDYITYIVTPLLNCKSVRRLYLKHLLKTKVVIPFNSQYYVKNDRALTVIRECFHSKLGGVHVIISPPGSGKSTYLRTYANDFIQNSDGYVKYFGAELSSPNDFRNAFTPPTLSLPQNDLFSVLPDKTVIVIDQLETQKFDTEMKLFMKSLAIQSRLTGKCNVVVSVSDIEMANEILQLNGLDKIIRAGTDDDFIWNDTEIEEFIELGCKQWKDEDKDSFRSLARLSRNPLFFAMCFSHISQRIAKRYNKVKRFCRRISF